VISVLRQDSGSCGLHRPRMTRLAGERNRVIAFELLNVFLQADSFERDYSRDQYQPDHDNNRSDSVRDPLPGRSESFGGNGRGHECHCPQVHGPKSQKDRRQIGTTKAAVKSKLNALLPGCPCICRHIAATGKVMCLPGRKLQGTGDHHDGTDGHRNSTC
jgi:hypothetical protein